MSLRYEFYDALRKLIFARGEKGERSSGYFPHLLRRFCARLAGTYRNARILDAGCGEGLLAFAAGQGSRVNHYFGTDLSLQMLDRAVQKDELLEGDSKIGLKAGLVSADLTCLPYKSGRFDLIFCLNVLINLPGEKVLDSIIRELSRVSKKGGRVVVDIRNRSNPFNFLRFRLRHLYEPSVDLPLVAYSTDDIIRRFGSAGLIHVGSTPIGFPWDPDLSVATLLQFERA